MPSRDKPARRRYHAPRRAQAAERTREAILEAATAAFEQRGWAGTTIAGIAATAGVSPKTVEAIFGTKANLLRAAVDFTIRGDADPVPMPRRAVVAEMEAVPDAATMLDLHAALVRSVSARSARVAWVVEHAAEADPAVAELWRRMVENRRFGVGWATRTLLGKPDAPALDLEHVERTFLVALEWGTYRTLTGPGGLTPDAFQGWLRAFYRGMLGA